MRAVEVVQVKPLYRYPASMQEDLVTIRNPQNPRQQIELTEAVVQELIRVARHEGAYKASWHVQAMADALERLLSHQIGPQA